MKITIISPVFSKVMTTEDAEILGKILKYKTSVWREGPFHKVQKDYAKSLIKKGIFLTGFLPRVVGHCERLKIPIEFGVLPQTPSPLSPTEVKYKLPPGVERFDPEQIEAIESIHRYQRGVIHYPTGSGKTTIFLSFISMFPTARSVIIVNTQDILIQTAQIAKRMFPGNVGILGAGENSINHQITVATIQSLNRMDLSSSFFKNLDIVIVDEAHHVSKFTEPFVRKGEGGSYAKVLSSILAPIRLGFTGTLPYIEEGKMALEGYIGPVISSKKPEEIKRLAKVIIQLKKLPETYTLKDLKTYPDVYRLGVIFNSRRNKQVVLDAEEYVKQGRTVLILVTAIQHGFNIKEMAERIIPHRDIEFVYGDMEGNKRDEIKKSLNEKRTEIVIADVVWKEGIDIPTLGAIINAAGGKSEIATLQNIGRGSRRVEGVKEDIILKDYFDGSHRYLVDHFGHRISLYFEKGWLGGENDK